MFNVTFVLSCNSNEIINTLGRAFNKPQFKDNTLNLQFCKQLTPDEKKLFISYQKRIVALDIIIFRGYDFLMEPSMKLDLLESLSIVLRRYNEPINMRYYTEALIFKHASTLKKLCLKDDNINLRRSFDDLDVPALPCLESLIVSRLHTETVWSLFGASKQTIASLDIGDVDVDTHPPIKNDNEASTIYQFPNLHTLAIYNSNFTKLLTYNANNITSLTLLNVVIPSDVPELPKLRELTILNCYDENYSHIFSMCKESLKCLVFNGIFFDDYNVDLPQLTDLYVKHSRKTSGKFLSYNNKSLEFLCLENVDPEMIILDDNVKLKRIKVVVLKHLYGDYTYNEKDKARMAELCPNAEILIWGRQNIDDMNDFVKSHHTKRGFSTIMIRTILDYFQY